MSLVDMNHLKNIVNVASNDPNKKYIINPNKNRISIPTHGFFKKIHY